MLRLKELSAGSRLFDHVHQFWGGAAAAFAQLGAYEAGTRPLELSSARPTLVRARSVSCFLLNQ
jgi:hypothetical protein